MKTIVRSKTTTLIIEEVLLGNTDNATVTVIVGACIQAGIKTHYRNYNESARNNYNHSEIYYTHKHIMDTIIVSNNSDLYFYNKLYTVHLYISFNA